MEAWHGKRYIYIDDRVKQKSSSLERPRCGPRGSSSVKRFVKFDADCVSYCFEPYAHVHSFLLPKPCAGMMAKSTRPSRRQEQHPWSSCHRCRFIVST